jgi:hypothetical protein
MDVSSKEFADELLQMECFYIWLFDYKSVGRGSEKMYLTDVEKEIFNKRITEINKEYPFWIINTEVNSEIGGCAATKGTMLHIGANGDVSPCIAVRFSHPNVNIKNHNIREIMNSDFFQSYRDIGCDEGCAQRFVPNKFMEWKNNNNLVPLYSKKNEEK